MVNWNEGMWCEVKGFIFFIYRVQVQNFLVCKRHLRRVTAQQNILSDSVLVLKAPRLLLLYLNISHVPDTAARVCDN